MKNKTIIFLKTKTKKKLQEQKKTLNCMDKNVFNLKNININTIRGTRVQI